MCTANHDVITFNFTPKHSNGNVMTIPTPPLLSTIHSSLIFNLTNHLCVFGGVVHILWTWKVLVRSTLAACILNEHTEVITETKGVVYVEIYAVRSDDDDDANDIFIEQTIRRYFKLFVCNGKTFALAFLSLSSLHYLWFRIYLANIFWFRPLVYRNGYYIVLNKI